MEGKSQNSQEQDDMIRCNSLILLEIIDLSVKIEKLIIQGEFLS